MARKHAHGLIRRFDRGGKLPQRRRPADRSMFRSLRIEAIEARVLLSAAGVDSDGLLDIATENSEAAVFTFNLSGDPVVARALGNFVLSGARAQVDSSSSDGGIDANDAPAMKMETPSFARFVPEEVRNSSRQDPESLVDITVAMDTSQRPGSLEVVGLRGEFKRVVDRTFVHRAKQSDHQRLAVDGQYAMLQAFELSGRDFDSHEAGNAAADGQSPPPNRVDPPPPDARPGEGDVTQASSTSQRQEDTERRDARSDSPAKVALQADEMTHDEQRVTVSPQPIGRSPHAALFEELGENQASDLFGPAAYLNLGRKSGIAPALIVAAGGQLLFGASWRSRRRLSPEPAIERPLRR